LQWEAITAAVAVVTLVAGGMGVYVHLSIRSALGQFKSDLLDTLNGRYLVRREADVILAEFERRIRLLEER